MVGRRAVMAGFAGGALGVPAVGRAAGPSPTGSSPTGSSPTGRLRESEPREVPGIAFTDGAGTRTELSAFAGKGVVLNLWATWCAPCVAEMPALDRAAKALEGEGIVVVALSSDRGGRGQVEPFYQRVNIRHLGMWFDERAAATRALGARGLPTTILIGRDGRERARLEGAAEWDSAEMLDAVRRLCGAGGEARPSPAAARRDEAREDAAWNRIRDARRGEPWAPVSLDDL